MVVSAVAPAKAAPSERRAMKMRSGSPAENDRPRPSSNRAGPHRSPSTPRPVSGSGATKVQAEASSHSPQNVASRLALTRQRRRPPQLPTLHGTVSPAVHVQLAPASSGTPSQSLSAPDEQSAVLGWTPPRHSSQ